MKYNELQTQKLKSNKRVGRGISAGGGKTAGRGTKGQNSRTGKKLRPMFQGGQRPLAQAVPKRRGFKSIRVAAQVVYSDRLNDLDGQTVDNALLFTKGYISTPFQSVKVIARDELTAKVDLRVQAASKSVIAEIEKLGGTFEKTSAPIRQSAAQVETAE